MLYIIELPLHLDDMNTYDASGNQVCRVDQYTYTSIVKIGSCYLELRRHMGAPTRLIDPTTGICNSTSNTAKLIIEVYLHQLLMSINMKAMVLWTWWILVHGLQ